MRDLQQQHAEWCEKNFGGREGKLHPGALVEALNLASHVGKIAHHTLKAHQGIRGQLGDHLIDREDTKKRLAVACIRTPLLLAPPRGCSEVNRLAAICGVVEEVGELTKAQSMEECIDAVGDVALYLMDYCTKTGIDFESAVRSTAAKVHQRDWNLNPVNGEVESESVSTQMCQGACCGRFETPLKACNTRQRTCSVCGVNQWFHFCYGCDGDWYQAGLNEIDKCDDCMASNPVNGEVQS